MMRRLAVVTSLLVLACHAPTDDEITARKLDLALSDRNNIESIRAEVTDRQRDFLRAFSKPDASAGDFVDMGTQFIDVDRPVLSAQATPRQQHLAQGYFSLLAVSPRPDHSEDRIIVRVEHRNYAIGVAIPSVGKPMWMSWERRRNGWMLTMLEINCSQSCVSGLRDIPEHVD